MGGKVVATGLAIGTALSIAAIAAPPGEARESIAIPTEVQVEIAVTALRAGADAGFLKAWGPSFAEVGVPYSAIRASALWMVLGSMLRHCRAFAAAGDEAAWRARFEAIDFGAGPGSTRAQGDARAAGLGLLRAPEAASGDRDGCVIELAAVRQVLSAPLR